MRIFSEKSVEKPSAHSTNLHNVRRNATAALHPGTDSAKK